MDKPKKVMVFGTFDLLHPGHLNFFEQARVHGDYLIAVVARDETVMKVKSKRPVHNELERLENVRKHVDEAVLGNFGDKYTVIKELEPDVICLGYDQVVFTEDLDANLKEFGLKAEVKRMKAHEPDKHKSSLLRK